MKVSIATVVALASAVAAMPAEKRAATACATAVTLTGNPFASRTLHPNPYYTDEITAAAGNITDATLKAQALKVASVGSFLWIDTISALEKAKRAVQNVPCDALVGLVVYDLPGRDCNAKASNGELAVGEISRYKTEYIDPFVEIIKANPNTAFVLIIEPDSLPNLVTNIDNPACSASAAGYREGVPYAMKNLNLPNVIMYIDAGHGGWLGWDANLAPGAKELAAAYTSAGKPSQFRGYSTNVAGWNAWDLSPGEFSKTSDAKYNSCQNEKTYVQKFSAAMKAAGAPAQSITDTGRNGVQGLRLEWGDWCNVNGAGFGVRPTSTTGEPYSDAFVWIKPGGESDGTSDTSATRYDSYCGKADAFQPAPEAGTWNQAYFEMLLKNAKPAF